MTVIEILRSLDAGKRRDLVQDTLGAFALFVMLAASLYLPVMV